MIQTLGEYSFKSKFYNVWKLLPLYRQLVMWIVATYNLGWVLQRALTSFWGPSKLHKEGLVHVLLARKLHHAVGLEEESLPAICISFVIATPANEVALKVNWSWITAHGRLLMAAPGWTPLKSTAEGTELGVSQEDCLDGSLIWMKPRALLLLTLSELISPLYHSYACACFFYQSSAERNQQQKPLEQYQMLSAHSYLTQDKQAWLLNHNFDSFFW